MMLNIENRKAKFEYFFLQEWEAGIVLVGTEIKSIREGKINFKDSYARIVDNEVWLFNLHISPYEKGSYFNHEAERKRKLLLHSREIKKMKSKTEEQGMTLVPKRLYINESGKCKLIIAIAKGKKTFDKRDSLQEKQLKRENDRKMKSFE
jgi:SsrA-binding protein